MNSKWSTEAERRFCLPGELLTSWLNGDNQLSSAEINHISECPKCTQLLDELSGAPELICTSTESQLATHFEQEPEFQELQQRLQQLSGTSGRHCTNQRLITTEMAVSSQAATTSEPFQEKQLQVLQRQLSGERYRLQRIPGSGGSGTVVLAFDTVQACDVAIKFLLRESPSERQRFGAKPEFWASWIIPTSSALLILGPVNTPHSIRPQASFAKRHLPAT